MPSKKPALGRNLGVLLGEPMPTTLTGAVQKLSITQLQPGHYQPRQSMDEEALSALADSIAEQGIIQPLVVRQVGQRYEIIAGERRWRAAQQVGLSEVPVIIRDLSDEATLAIALIENIQREDLQPLEEAEALARLIDEFDLTHEQAARAVGRSRVAVSNLLRLLSLPVLAKGALARGEIEMGHARALLSLSDKQQRVCLQTIIERGLNVRQTEALVRDQQSSKTSSVIENKMAPELLQRQQRLSSALAAKVAIKQGAGGRGKIIIQYQSSSQLEALLAQLTTLC